MKFNEDTWWLVLLIVSIVVGLVTYLLRRTLYGSMDKIEVKVDYIEKNYATKNEHNLAFGECKEDIKKIREDYTPKETHSKDIDECRRDIKKITENYLTKEDFLRAIDKTDRKLDKIMDFLLKKGEQ